MSLPLKELVETPALVNDRAQPLEWDELLFEYERALDDHAALLIGLSDAQLHFKPEIKVFSIAEGLTHALHSDELFWSWVTLLMAGRRAEIDPAALIAGDGAQSDRSSMEITALIEAVRLIARNAIEHQPESIDLHSTSPHPYFGELNAKGWVMFMTLHHGMHLRQCERVIGAPGFPHGASKQSLTADEYLQPRDRKTWLRQDARSKKQNARSGKQVTASKRKSGSAKSASLKKKPSGEKKQSSRRPSANR